MQESLAELIQRVKSKTGKSIPIIAAETGLKEANLYKWEKGTRPSNADEHNQLKHYLERQLENIPAALMVEEPEIIYQSALHRSATVRLTLSSNLKPLPNTDISLTSGSIIHSEGKPELIVYRFNVPSFGAAEGILEVSGDSMSPTFKSGSQIAITRIQDFALVIPGEYYYIIDKNEQGILRRIELGKTKMSFVLMADNENQKRYRPITRQYKQILAILKVNALITKW